MIFCCSLDAYRLYTVFCLSVFLPLCLCSHVVLIVLPTDVVGWNKSLYIITSVYHQWPRLPVTAADVHVQNSPQQHVNCASSLPTFSTSSKVRPFPWLHVQYPQNDNICHFGYYIVSQKNCAKLFLSELCQISTNFFFIIFGRKMTKKLKLCGVHSLSTSPN